jgi:DNA-binding NarL/FixJ family response regulator
MKRVLVAVPDLFFGLPITNAVRAAGAEPIPVRRPEDPFAALASEAPHPPDAVIVDLAARLDPADVIAAAAAQNIPVFAFGSHLDTAAIMAARAAGADKVVANSAMAGALPAWLAYHLAHGPAEG